METTTEGTSILARIDQLIAMLEQNNVNTSSEQMGELHEHLKDVAASMRGRGKAMPTNKVKMADQMEKDIVKFYKDRNLL